MKKLFALAIAALAASLLFVGCEKLGGGSVDTSKLEGTWIATSGQVSIQKNGKAVDAKTFLTDMCAFYGVDPKDIDEETTAMINEMFTQMSGPQDISGGSLTFVDGKVFIHSVDEDGEAYTESGSYTLDGHNITLTFEGESMTMQITKLTSTDLTLKMSEGLSRSENGSSILPGYTMETYLNFIKE